MCYPHSVCRWKIQEFDWQSLGTMSHKTKVSSHKTDLDWRLIGHVIQIDWPCSNSTVLEVQVNNSNFNFSLRPDPSPPQINANACCKRENSIIHLTAFCLKLSRSQQSHWSSFLMFLNLLINLLDLKIENVDDVGFRVAILTKN